MAVKQGPCLWPGGSPDHRGHEDRVSASEWACWTGPRSGQGRRKPRWETVAWFLSLRFLFGVMGKMRGLCRVVTGLGFISKELSVCLEGSRETPVVSAPAPRSQHCLCMGPASSAKACVASGGQRTAPPGCAGPFPPAGQADPAGPEGGRDQVPGPDRMMRAPSSQCLHVFSDPGVGEESWKTAMGST